MEKKKEIGKGYFEQKSIEKKWVQGNDGFSLAGGTEVVDFL